MTPAPRVSHATTPYAPMTGLRRRLWLAVAGAACVHPGAYADYFDRYGLQAASSETDLGTQPTGVPSGVLSAVMRRDHHLQEALTALKRPLRSHGFRRGADMLGLLADQRLDAGLLGDMPTLLSAAAGQVWIVGLVKQTTTALIARDNLVASGLAGKRIAYVEASSAHLTLLQGLSSAGLTEQNVQLVPMAIVDMPQALEDGKVDAFSAWEPFITIALNRNPRNHIVFRGASADYFVIARAFAQQSPQAALQLIAGFVRALEWMRAAPRNMEQAARWSILDSEAFSGAAPAVTTTQVRSIVRRELLDVPSAPALVDDGGRPRLKPEFDFLRRLGKLPAQASWTQVEAALAYDGLHAVLSDARRYRLRSFDYRP